MNPQVFVRRQPVVNRNKAITAARLIVHAPNSAMAAAALNQLNDVWPTARSVMVGLAGAHPDEELGAWDSPDNVMLEIPASGLDMPPVSALIERCREFAVPLCLDGYEPGMAVPAAAEFRFLLADARRVAKVGQAPGLLLAKELADSAAFAQAVEGGYAGAAGWFFRNAAPLAKKLNPGQAQIVRVLNLVRKNADIREIETALKFDVTLSYKLLRYINSAGFGLSCEIQSFRHAVSILGYDKLHRWLSLLLVTASKDPAAPALMQTAIARGRFMELVGKGFFQPAELDNLFIAGTFSLLDTLLGADLKSALEGMHLPEAVNEALLERSGVFAPFLELALACERDEVDTLAAQAASLAISADTINRAQLQALGFADSMQLN